MAFRGPIKHFESAPPESDQSGDGKQTFFKSSLIRYFYYLVDVLFHLIKLFPIAK